jgi:hypothetical protein
LIIITYKKWVDKVKKGAIFKDVRLRLQNDFAGEKRF